MDNNGCFVEVSSLKKMVTPAFSIFGITKEVTREVTFKFLHSCLFSCGNIFKVSVPIKRDNQRLNITRDPLSNQYTIIW